MNLKQKVFVYSCAFLLIVWLIYVGMRGSNFNFLQSLSVNSCPSQSDLNGKITLKDQFFRWEMTTTLRQKNINTTQLANNATSLTENQSRISQAQIQILTDAQLVVERARVDVIKTQRDARVTLENLESDKNTKKTLADTDKINYERFWVATAEQAYNTALQQYNAKVELKQLLSTRDSLSRPSTAQINARRNLETTYASAIWATNQIVARQDLETKANVSARIPRPARTPANTYQRRLQAYNTAVSNANTAYNTAFTAYNSTYASSQYGVTMTFKQLDVATKYTAYTNALRTYNNNRSFTADKTLTLSQLNDLVTAYNTAYSTANSNYTTKLTAYNTTYVNDRRTEAQLLAIRDTRKSAFDKLRLNPQYVSAKTQYDTVSYPAYTLALNMYTTQKTTYDTTYPSTNTLSSSVLTQQYNDANAIITRHNQNVIILRDLRVENGSLTAMKNQLEAERTTIDGQIATQNERLATMNQEIADIREAMQKCIPQWIVCDVVTKNENGTLSHTLTLKDGAWNSVGDPSNLAIGQSDKNKQRYILRYSPTQIVAEIGLYYQGNTYSCPEITYDTNEFADVGDCFSELNALEPSERIGIQCLWDDRLEIATGGSSLPSNMLWSSFLGSSMLRSNTLEEGWTDGFCWDNACNNGEDCNSCSGDCGSCPETCWNNDCVSPESCGTCPADCGSCGESCWNGTCGWGENCETCSSDCGTCTVTPYCGDSTCDSNEDCTSCSSDCGTCPVTCWNGNIESGETCDDGNTTNWDGCDSSCQTENEPCTNWAINPTACDLCPAGNVLNENNICEPYCENGAINHPECDQCRRWQHLRYWDCIDKPLIRLKDSLRFTWNMVTGGLNW